MRMSSKKKKSEKPNGKPADPFKGKFTEISAIPGSTVVPNEEGKRLVY